MSRIQNGKNRNPEKPISGCLGRMVNLFDLNSGMGGSRLLTDKPHHDGSGSGNGTPIKMLIAQEMSKEDECKQSPSNLVAKLMGLDSLPVPQQHQQPQPLVSASYRSHSRSQSESLESKHEITKCPEQEEYKDVYEIWQQHYKERCSSEKQSESKMDLIREKFMEAKRLSTDEKLRHSKQFQDALEVLSSNKDLFLKFLQEPNSLFSQHLYNLQSVPPPPDSRRITVLRPSKLVDPQNKIEKKQDSKPWDKTASDILFSPECCKTDENPIMQPTRIVILKPHNIKVVDSHDDVFDGDPEDVSEVLESRQVEEEEIGLRRDETLLSSVFSNGYIGDDSSFCKSEIDYAAGNNLSDSEAVSPTSRHSWDYINRFNSHHYATSSSRASYSPESSVCREAKKRLSERWAMMASNKNVQEQRQIQRSSSTLGDMLALSDLKKSESEENKQEFIMGSSDLNKGEYDDNSPRKLPRSKSVPTSSGVSGSLDGKGDDSKLVSSSSSFKGRVSSLFFSKNKKSRKDKSNQSKDEPSPRNEGSECVNEIEDESCSGLYRRSQGIFLPEAGLSFKNPGNHSSENQDQPSPISVLEPQFEEDDHTTNANLNQHGVDPMKYKLIDKSPPIGSISRTLLSWGDDASLGSATPYYYGKPSSSAPLNPQEEEQQCLLYLETLLSVAGLSKTRTNSLFARWHSPESPLDPSLRDKYMNLTEKAPLLSQNKQRHHHHHNHRSMTKLVFDCANEALLDIGSGSGSGARMAMMTSALVGECVWARMKEWLFSGEERWEDSDGDGGSVVEEVVRKEVVGRGWAEGLRLEIDDTRKDIEGKLLEELVEESVLELTGRAS